VSDPGFDPTWLPPSPHREAILAFLADGRAHVAEQGHGRPPLLVFEDGGAIELPRVRYAPTERGMELIAAETPEAPDQTKHRDVCGALDELKARIAADPGQAAAEREALFALAEAIRDRANAMEKCLARHKGVATRAGGVYDGICGARQWDRQPP